MDHAAIALELLASLERLVAQTAEALNQGLPGTAETLARRASNEAMNLSVEIGLSRHPRDRRLGVG